MQPRNSFEQQIEEAGRTLRPISARQIRWAFDRCFVRYGRRTTKGVITCTECGHAWRDKTARKHCICPSCHTRLTIDDNHLRRIYDTANYALFMTVHNGMQVLRFVYLAYYVRIGERAKYIHFEVVQRWIAPDGRCATRARLITNRPFYKTWDYTTSLELRPHKPLYNIHPRCVHPRPQLLPELRRSGYNGQFHHISPPEMFCALLRDSRAETLLKTGQVTLLKHFAENTRTLDDYWPSVRIVLRNEYAIADTEMWCDYIDLLRFFGKDLRNARYVCPADLRTEHDRYVVKKRKYEQALAEEERLREKAQTLELAIEPRLLSAFKRIRNNSHNGLGIVYVERGACGGCFNKIPPQRQLDIRMRKKIIVCEYCGRIMIDPELAGVKIETTETEKPKRRTRKLAK